MPVNTVTDAAVCLLPCSDTDSDDDYDATQNEVAGNFALLRQKTGLVKLYEMMRKADLHGLIGVMSWWGSLTNQLKVCTVAQLYSQL